MKVITDKNMKKDSVDRKQFLKKIKIQKCLVLVCQIGLLMGFLLIWEIAATKGMIDSFITSQPSEIFSTFINLLTNDLSRHIWVTTYETIVGFLLGTLIGVVVAIILWCSKFLAKVADPYLVVLNSLPKVALRTNYYYMGRSTVLML